MPYNEQAKNRPLEMRIKPKAGFVEIDVPIATEFHYNQSKAKTWGDALNKAKVEGAHGYGMAAGFANATGFRAASQRIARPAKKAEDEDSDSEAEKHKMRHQTLGGQIVKGESRRPFYMVGAFRGGERKRFNEGQIRESTNMVPRPIAFDEAQRYCTNAASIPSHRRKGTSRP